LAEPEAVEPSSEPLRTRLLAFLRERIGEVGKHIRMSTKDLAGQFGVTPVTISKHLHGLSADGYIHIKAAGPKGTIITLEAGPRRGPGRPPAAARGDGLRRVGNDYYCPWCGSKVQKAWRYCNRCGEHLPA